MSFFFGDDEEAAARMMSMLTVNGARSLGVMDAGLLEEGYQADLVALDLDHLALAGCSPESLPLDIIFSFLPGLVTDVWCQGVEVVSHRHHRAENQARDNLRRVMSKLRRSSCASDSGSTKRP